MNHEGPPGDGDTVAPEAVDGRTTSTAVLPSNGLVPGSGFWPMCRIASSQLRATFGWRGFPLAGGVFAASSARCRYCAASERFPSARYSRPVAA
ncbi:hypothetical protein ACWEQK_34750, partial [Streptomyces parvulus]